MSTDGAVLALSASRPNGTAPVCVVRDPTGRVVPCRGTERPARGSDLVAVVDETLRAAGLETSSVGEIRVDIGPGSYTGLRVAVTCARFLSHFGGSRLRTATSFDLIAQRVASTTENATELHVLLDARRERAYHRAVRIDAAGRVSTVFGDAAAVELDRLGLPGEPTHPGDRLIACADPAIATREADGLRGFDEIRTVPDYGADDLLAAGVDLRACGPDEIRPLYLMGSYAE